MIAKRKYLFIGVLALASSISTVPRLVVAQSSYYTWNIAGFYTYPYQEFLGSAQYPLEISSVSVTIPTEEDVARRKGCRIYLNLADETTTLSITQKNFDVNPETKWRTDDGCVLAAIGEPDLNAKVALVTDDSATHGAPRDATTNASVFPDFSSLFCQKIAVSDEGVYTQMLFPTPTPTPSPTPNPDDPNANKGSGDFGDVALGDYRQSLTITLPATTSIRTVTYPGGPDCKSLVVFRPWNK